jgi:amino acid adenylation domain-containing protein
MVGDRRITPTAPSQRQLWFLDQFIPDSVAYNIAFSLRFRGPLNVDALERSIDALVERHAVLRTTFAAQDGQPVQVIAPTLSLPLPLFDLQHLPEAERRDRVARLTLAEARQPLDLEVGPLIRTTLLRLGAHNHHLLITIHHIIADEWSIDLLGHELGVLYSADVSGTTPELSDLPLQYADFARQQEERQRSELSGPDLSYWFARLADAPVTLTIPTDRPRPPAPTSRGATESVVIPSGLVESLTQLSRQEGATIFMTVLAAFYVLLFRYTGEDDLVVGCPIAGRARTEYEGLIGFFINTLVLRADLSGNPTFREFLKRILTLALDAYTHQEMPLERLVEVLRPHRDPSYNPMFQLMLVFLNTPEVTMEFAGLTVEFHAEDTATAKFDLTLYLARGADGLVATAEYNTDLFDPGTISRLLGHFQMLLKNIVIDPAARLSALALLTRSELDQLRAWNATDAPYSDRECLHDLFASQAKRTPHTVAVTCGEEEITYRDLDRRSNQFANHLRAMEVGPGTLVGICVERSLEMVVGLLGILKAGGAYLPLDPGYPRARLEYMLQHSRAEVLVTQERLSAYLPMQQGRVVCIDRQWSAIARESTEAPVVDVSTGDPAYLMYTSGSTGQPKGVVGLHRGAVNRLQWMWEAFPFEPDEVCCQKTSLSFVDSVWEIFGPLSRGIRTVIIPDPIVKDPQALARTLAGSRVTRIVLVPSLLRELLDTFPDPAHQVPRLRLWVSSGEVLPTDLADRFLACLPESKLINLYGSSEVAADVTWHSVAASAGLPSVPIGRPIANTEIHLVDRHFQQVPIGVPGEILVGGRGLAAGYLHRPDLTAASFLPNPFRDEVDARLYRTGDLGRYRADGTIEYLGRTDYQVKLRGMRIELGEIETVLRRHPEVEDAVVLLEGDTPEGARLAGYVVPRPGSGAGVGELKRHLRESLPAYMVPATVAVLEKLPRTPNGKLDRRAMQSGQPRQAGAGDTRFVPPRTPEETKLAEIWRAVLRLDEVGVEDDFFELGGHSLLATQVVSRIRDTFQVDFPLHTLFVSPTIAALGAKLPTLSAVGDLPLDRRTAARPRPAAAMNPLIVPAQRLHKVQEAGTRHPLFFLYPEVTTAFYGLDLARRLGEDQPFFIIHPHGFDGGPIPLTIVEMAAETLKLVRAAQPEGPYRLAARCAAGTETFELARQLRAQGEKVDLVVLIDAEIPPYKSDWLPRVRRAGERLRLSELRQRRLYLSLSRPRHRYGAQLDQATKLLSAVKDIRYGKDGTAPGLKQAWADSLIPLQTGGRLIDDRDLCYFWAFDGYKPGWYDGEVTLFLSNEWMATRYDDVVDGWRRLADRVAVHGIGGTHLSCVSDHAPSLAARLRSCLSAVEAAGVSEAHA